MNKWQVNFIHIHFLSYKREIHEQNRKRGENRAVPIPAKTSLKKCACSAILEYQTSNAVLNTDILTIIVILFFREANNKIGNAKAILFVA